VRINGKALKAIREKDGHSQASLARRSGITQGRISEFEAGLEPVRAATAKKLATALGVPLSAIAVADEPSEAVA
jgi:transcriptional regulator with XRE-family HTH domain